MILLILIIADTNNFNIIFNYLLWFDSNNLSFYLRNYYISNNFRSSAKNKIHEQDYIGFAYSYTKSIFYLQLKHKNRHWCNCFLIISSWQFCAYYFVLTQEWIMTRRNRNEFAMNLILIYIKHDNVILLVGSKWCNIKNDLSWVS